MQEIHPSFPLIFISFILISLTGCGVSQVPTVSENSQDHCIVDTIKQLRKVATIPVCAESDKGCQRKCLDGIAENCVGQAYAIEKDPTSKEEAVSLFRRACKLGLAIGCTNYGASIWAREHSETEAECAQKIFMRSCEADEPFACGMAGRVMADKAKTKDELESARKFLELKCERLGNFPCRALAKHYEEGDFGSIEPFEIKKLLKKACDGGDPGGCGDPKTAAETFH